ncbi:MAG: PEP-CTERM sorting domain-containing protein [Steroidobacteraceae bacterium]
MFSVNATATATATASFGSLHGTASAVYELTPGSITDEGYDDNGNPYSYTIVNPLEVAASADAFASFQDTFQITSSTLPYGTAVEIAVTPVFDGTGSGNGCWSLGVTVDTGDYESIDPGGCGNGAQAYTQTVDMPAYVGFEDDSLVADLAADTGVPYAPCRNSDNGYGNAGSGPDCDSQVAEESAADTANIYVDLLSPDASITFESGHDYSTPAPTNAVPEPPSLPMLLAGLAAMGGALMVQSRRGFPRR